MAEQETLDTTHPQTHDPLAHSLWKRFVDHSRINHGAWLRACAERAYVGTCRACGGYLVPHTPYDVGGGRTDYAATCGTPLVSTMVDGKRVVTGCGKAVAAPGGRVLIRSSLKSERPGGGE